jgi:hypothetical protein
MIEVEIKLTSFLDRTFLVSRLPKDWDVMDTKERERWVLVHGLATHTKRHIYQSIEKMDGRQAEVNA